MSNFSDISRSTIDLEQNKFLGDANDRVAVRVIDAANFQAGVDYDTITATYPDTVTEVFTYSLAAATVRTVTVTYVSSDKRDINTVVVS